MRAQAELWGPGSSSSLFCPQWADEQLSPSCLDGRSWQLEREVGSSDGGPCGAHTEARDTADDVALR